MHLNILSAIILLIVELSIQSCSPVIYLLTGNERNVDKKMVYMKNDSTNQEAVFVPTVHIGKPEYYARVKRIIDSLRKDGFVIFYESVYYCDTVPNKTRDTIDRKLRKVLGFHLTSYDDKENKSLPRTTREREIAQTLENTGITEDDIHADLCVEELVRRYEAEKGEIILTDYDFNTGLMDKYRLPRKEKKQYSEFYMTRNIRDEYLASLIKSHNYPKVAAVYGGGHKWWFIGNMYHLGYDWIKRPCKK